MSRFLILEVMKGSYLDDLRKHPDVKLLNNTDSITQKIIEINGPWIRDHVVKIGDKWFESCNPSNQKKSILAHSLRTQAIEVEFSQFVPIQGGHLVRCGDRILCASSCGIHPDKILTDYRTKGSHSWELENFDDYLKGESKKNINSISKDLLVLPSLKVFPWSYHLDLMISSVGENLVLLSNPLLYPNDYSQELAKEFQIGINQYEVLLNQMGIKAVHFPTFYEEKSKLYHCPLNGLKVEDSFYYTLIEGQDSFNEYTQNYIKNLSIPLRFKPLYLSQGSLGKKGGVRCLSIELN